MGKWLIAWKERGRSGPVNDSFLWRSDRLYIMDNHRLALWCWWQHLDSDPRGWDFLHVDRHYDALWQKALPWREYYDPRHKVDLSSFRRAKFPSKDVDELDLYRWDNITSGLWALDGNKIHSWTFATAGEDEPLRICNVQNINPWSLPKQLQQMANPTGEDISSLVDIDIDYFTCTHNNGSYTQVFSDQYLREIGSAISEGLTNNRFGVVTVALSPTTTGSWELAEELCLILLEGYPSLPEFRAGVPELCE